jgi:beta-glucosidase-like glycosyl hydrolase
MKAVAAHWHVEETVVESLCAGADCFLACRDPDIQKRAEDALTHAAELDPAVRRHIEDSAARLRAFRATLLAAPTARPGSFESLRTQMLSGAAR